MYSGRPTTSARVQVDPSDAASSAAQAQGQGADDRSDDRLYEQRLDKLKRLGLPVVGRDERLTTKAKVAHLAKTNWRALRADPAFKSAADWNHLRRSLSAFLTTFVGDVYHPFRRQVMKKIKLRKERPRVPDVSVELFWRIVAAAPEHARPCYVTLAARTGPHSAPW